MYIHMCMCTYIYIFWIYMYVCVSIHTHTHACTHILVFIPGTQLLTILEYQKWWVSFCMLMNEWWLEVSQNESWSPGDELCDQSIRTFSRTAPTSEMVKGMKAELIMNDHWWSLHKNPKGVFREHPCVLLDIWRCWKGKASVRTW